MNIYYFLRFVFKKGHIITKLKKKQGTLALRHFVKNYRDILWHWDLTLANIENVH